MGAAGMGGKVGAGFVGGGEHGGDGGGGALGGDGGGAGGDGVAGGMGGEAGGLSRATSHGRLEWARTEKGVERAALRGYRVSPTEKMSLSETPLCPLIT